MRGAVNPSVGRTARATRGPRPEATPRARVFWRRQFAGARTSPYGLDGGHSVVHLVADFGIEALIGAAD